MRILPVNNYASRKSTNPYGIKKNSNPISFQGRGSLSLVSSLKFSQLYSKVTSHPSIENRWVAPLKNGAWVLSGVKENIACWMSHIEDRNFMRLTVTEYEGPVFIRNLSRTVDMPLTSTTSADEVVGAFKLLGVANHLRLERFKILERSSHEITQGIKRLNPITYCFQDDRFGTHALVQALSDGIPDLERCESVLRQLGEKLGKDDLTIVPHEGEAFGFNLVQSKRRLVPKLEVSGVGYGYRKIKFSTVVDLNPEDSAEKEADNIFSAIKTIAQQTHEESLFCDYLNELYKGLFKNSDIIVEARKLKQFLGNDDKTKALLATVVKRTPEALALGPKFLLAADPQLVSSYRISISPWLEKGVDPALRVAISDGNGLKAGREQIVPIIKTETGEQIANNIIKKIKAEAYDIRRKQ